MTAKAKTHVSGRWFAPRKEYPDEVARCEQGGRVADALFYGPLWPIVVLSAREALGKVRRWDETYTLALALWRGVP